MRDIVAVFRERLQRAIDEKKITKTELHRVTKIARPTIDSYLDGAEPGLRAAGKIADALGWELLGAESDPIDAGELGEVIAALIKDPKQLTYVRDLLGLPEKAASERKPGNN